MLLPTMKGKNRVHVWIDCTDWHHMELCGFSARYDLYPYSLTQRHDIPSILVSTSNEQTNERPCVCMCVHISSLCSVSLEVAEDGTPKSPEESALDGLPKLYVHQHAFMKVLGSTLDVDTDKMQPILYDREGNLMDPNA